MTTKPSVKMSPSEIAGFLSRMRFAAVAAPDGRGGIAAALVPCQAATGGRLDLPVVDLRARKGALPAREGACLMADTAGTYADIKGVMLRGRTAESGDGQRFESAHATGFDFTKMPPTRP